MPTIRIIFYCPTFVFAFAEKEISAKDVYQISHVPADKNVRQEMRVVDYAGDCNDCGKSDATTVYQYAHPFFIPLGIQVAKHA